MPLIEMSPNVQEAEGTRKRSHDEYAAEDVGAKAATDGPASPKSIHSRLGISAETPDANHGMTDSPPLSPTRTPSPIPSLPDKASPAAAATSIPAHPKPDNPAKRKRLTPAEKAAKADEEAKKKKEREESRQQKAAEKAAEKARAEKEKAEAKAARQAEKARREEAEQEAKAAKQQEREDKRRRKDEEERRAREERERKERSQLKLQSFFKKPTTPKKVAPVVVKEEEKSPEKGSPRKREKSQYERMFQPFFVKSHVRVARQRPWLDDDAAAAKTRILDEYVSGERAAPDVAPLNPLEALQLPARPRREGRAHPSVRGIMEELQGGNAGALERLRGVPVKLICFRQDVRPPYCGTLTAVPQGGEPRLRRAARRPNHRVLELQYDYDSEAEWQDDEPGDDLDDLDDEEEEADDEDDMDGFLDDSEDAGVARRIFVNEMEPESTGVCWEDGEGAAKLKPYRMEVMLETVAQEAGIDPFSTSYWSPPKSKMPPPGPSPQAPTANPSASNPASAPDDPKTQIKNPELIPEFKEAVLANRKLSKLAIVEVLGLQFEGLGKAQTKAMLEYVAERGHGKGKVWELRAGV